MSWAEGVRESKGSMEDSLGPRNQEEANTVSRQKCTVLPGVCLESLYLEPFLDVDDEAFEAWQKETVR